MLDRFGGLEQALISLEQPYWRRMFDNLSERAHTDTERVKEVANKLRKWLRRNNARFLEDDESMMRLAIYVFNLARRLSAPSRDLPFYDFEEHARHEAEEINRSSLNQREREHSPADLNRALARLTERGVLLMGIQPRCPSCGYRAWHHLDDARQNIRCGGCGIEYAIPPESDWYYRLNSLVRAALAQHGLLPVVLVLGQMGRSAMSTSFLFAPCMDLFETHNGKPIGDLDIAVILDGKFVIGEIKQSRDRFDQETFRKMEKIARRLLPDTLIFASMDRDPNGLITREIERLSEKLRDLRIAVEWYRLGDHMFEVSLVR